MSMRDRPAVLALGLLALAGLVGAGQTGAIGAAGPGLGRPASPEDIRRMDITVAADGAGLPAGSGSVADGRATYEAKCLACHGPSGGGGLAVLLGVDGLRGEAARRLARAKQALDNGPTLLAPIGGYVDLLLGRMAA